MPVKIVLYYNQAQRGWTETWYKDGSTVPFEPPADDKPVFREAVAFRANDTTLYAVRYSDVDSPRKSNLIRLDQLYTSPLPDTDTPDVVSTDASYKLISATSKKRRISLRGVPDSAVKRDIQGIDKPSPGFLAGVERYFNRAYSAAWSIRAQDPPVVGGNAALPVLSMKVNPTDSRSTIITLRAALPAAYLPMVKIRFLNPPRQDLIAFPRSTYILQLSDTDPAAFSIPYRWRGPAIYFPLNTQVMLLKFNYSPLLNWAFERFSERKTGRPFGSLAGRARAVARAR